MEWDFIFRAMQYYAFPKKFINWVKILYADVESCIINDGNISNLSLFSKRHSSVSMYADDTTIITERNINSIIAVFKVLEDIAIVCGLKGNW